MNQEYLVKSSYNSHVKPIEQLFWLRKYSKYTQFLYHFGKKANEDMNRKRNKKYFFLEIENSWTKKGLVCTEI